MLIGKLHGYLAGITFLWFIGQTTDLQALSIPRVWPMVCTLGSQAKKFGSYIVNSRLFKPFAILSAMVVAGYLGARRDSSIEKQVEHQGHLPQLNGIDEDQGCSSRQPVIPYRQVVTRERTYWDLFTNEGYLRRGDLKLHERVNSVAGMAISVPTTGSWRVQVQQPVVVNQFDYASGGGASCGYQALKNALGISAMLLGVDKRTWLTNRELVNRLFGLPGRGVNAGIWRTIIMKQRQQAALCWQIKERYLSLNAINEAEIDADGYAQGAIQGLYQTLRNSYVTEIVKELDSGKEFVLTPERFIAWIISRDINLDIQINEQDMAHYKSGTSVRDIMNYIKDPAIIRRYLNLRGSDGMSINKLSLLEDVQWYDDNEWQVGEEIHEGDIKNLIEEAKHDLGVEQLADVQVCVLDDVHRNFLEKTKINDDLSAIRSAIERGEKLPHSVYAFILGSMLHKGDGGSAGHWVTLVLDTLVPCQRRYTLADSAGNRICLYNGTCCKFIQYLEGGLETGKLRWPDWPQMPGISGFFARKWLKFGDCLDH